MKKKLIINLTVLVSIFIALIGGRYAYRHFLISSEINEIKKELVDNTFCIIRFEVNGINRLIDKQIPCGNKIAFTKNEINILLNDTSISCDYEITYNSMILIENCDYLDGKLDNEYSISTTRNGINLLSDNVLLIAK